MTKRQPLWVGVVIAALLTAPLIGLMYLADKWLGFPFMPYAFFDWVTRVLPGPIVTFGIDRMIDTLSLLGLSVADTAKSAEQAIAVVQFAILGVATGSIYFAYVRARKGAADLVSGLILGALFGLPMVAISIALGGSNLNPILQVLWQAALFLAWGVASSRVIRRTLALPPRATAAEGETRSVERLNRRQFLVVLGAGSATVTVLTGAVGAVLASAERRRLGAALEGSPAHTAEGGTRPSFPNANDPVTPVPGTRPEYTPLKDHYKVFIQAEPTVIDGASWVLPIMGMVDNPLMLTLEDLQSRYEPRDQYVTLSCISGRIGTSLISTTSWTGVSLREVLAEARVQEGARHLHITCGDGFYETVDLDLINADERIMLCYAWDGKPLPYDHGFPLRIWIPDRYGMKQPKWITGIEVVDEYREGYWVERGWDEVAQVKTTSVIDTVAVNGLVGGEGGQVRVPVGGIAFSGARGISKVEVRVDGGPWEEAQLRSPLSETTWVIWRYEWPFQTGEHTFEVRCAEGDGTPQVEEMRPSRPSGATGIHSRQATL